MIKDRLTYMAVEKIPIAIICDYVPPYRLCVHRRVVREIPQIRLWTLCTHRQDPRWAKPTDEDIGYVSFDTGLSNEEHGKHPLREWHMGGRITRWLKEHGIPAVVLWGYHDLARFRIVRWCYRNNVPCFINGDSNISNEHGNRIKRIVKQTYVRHVLKHSAGAMPFGTRGKAYFMKYGVPGDKLFPFPLEPDYDLIRNLPDELVRSVREQFGISDDRRRLLYSGRLIPCKRIDQLIDAFAAIAERRPSWDLVLLGDGELREELQARVPQSLRQRVIWAGHASDPAVVDAFYEICDVLVLPSDREAWALVIHEAVACGMAIVSSDVPGAAADLVRDGVNGRMYPAGDLAKLTESLLDVTEDGRAEKMRAASSGVLESMRREFDPIQGLRKALRSAGVLSDRVHQQSAL